MGDCVGVVLAAGMRFKWLKGDFPSSGTRALPAWEVGGREWEVGQMPCMRSFDGGCFNFIGEMNAVQTIQDSLQLENICYLFDQRVLSLLPWEKPGGCVVVRKKVSLSAEGPLDRKMTRRKAEPT